MLEQFARFVPSELSHRSGNVFYSGRAAFSKPTDLYILGYNPGGNAAKITANTIAVELENSLKRQQDNFSQYRDVEWDGNPAGTHKMQPNVLHMLNKLSRDPGTVPSSNLIFVRSKDANAIKGEAKHLAELCWSFHAAVIQHLHIRAILCFGRETTQAVRNRLAAHHPKGEFIESNDRNWTSRAFANAEGQVVIGLTHPSRAVWTNPDADPTPLVRALLVND